MNRSLRTLPLIFTASLFACAAGQDNGETFVSITASNGDDDESSDSAEVGSESTSSDSSSDTGSDSSSDSSTGTSSDSSTGTSSDSSDSSTTDDPPCVRRQHTYTVGNGTWNSLPLDQVWVGANAPACAVAPAATIYIAEWDHLIVIGEDQMSYRRISGVWEAPLPLGDSFAALIDNPVTAGLYQVDPLDPNDMELVFLSPGKTVAYNYTAQGAYSFSNIFPLIDSPPPAPSLLSEQVPWAFTLLDKNLEPDLDWRIWSAAVTDGKFYQQFGDLSWANQPLTNNEFFNGAPGEPDPNTIEAAFAKAPGSQINFIAPD